MGTEVINTNYKGEIDKDTKDIVLNKISEAIDRMLSYNGECSLDINISISNKDNTFGLTTNTVNNSVSKPEPYPTCPVTENTPISTHEFSTAISNLVWRKELTDLDNYGIDVITSNFKYIANWYLQRYEHSSGPMFSPDPNKIPIVLRNLRNFIKYLYKNLELPYMFIEAKNTIDMYEEDIKYKLNKINYIGIEKNFVRELRKIMKYIS